MKTHLSLVSVDNHGHTLHIYASRRNTLQAFFEFFIKAIKVLRGDRANINWKVNACRSRVFFEINIRAIRR